MRYNLFVSIYKYCGLFTLLWFLIIFILCATPGQYIPSANWLELLSVDKFVHATIFFVLTALFFLTAIKHQRSNGILILCLGICIFYGAALEWMQANYFTNRSADWQDIVANGFGCLMALFLIKKLRIIHLQSINNA